jgi:aspartyl-tRNA(Asn)/glutamyl-tRNA(Gln) amidotransferase subunit A
MYLNSRSEGFGNEVKRRIMLGTYVLSAGYYDAYYRKAQKVRRLLKQDFDKAFLQVDIILTPTTPTTAFKIGEKTNDPLEMYLEDIYTTSANLVGIPGINIPIGKDSNGLPIGMQLMANLFEEEKLIQLSKFFDE